MAQIDWKDFTEAFPAFVVILSMPLSFSIATGLSFGVIFYTIVKLATGKMREISVVVWVLTIVFLLRYVYLAAA
jgi:AGZA family xanthine/uracil permease-like MFS transporter